MRWAQFEAIAHRALRQADVSESDFTVFRHSLKLESQDSQAAHLVQEMRSLIKKAFKTSPPMYLAWAGVCVILPTLATPSVTERSANNVDGLLCILSRTEYFVELERVCSVNFELESHILELYQRILQFLINTVLQSCQLCFTTRNESLANPGQNETALEMRQYRHIERQVLKILQHVPRQDLEKIKEAAQHQYENWQSLLPVAKHGQQNEDGPIKEFRAYIERYIRRHSCFGENEYRQNVKFVSRRALTEYWTRERVLSVLCVKDRWITANCETIIRSYIIVFSILVMNRRAEDITLFIQADVQDTKLPLELVPSPFSDSPETILFEEFMEAQWTFCPLTFGHGSETFPKMRKISPFQILPVVEKAKLKPQAEETINESITYKVKLHQHCADFSEYVSVYIFKPSAGPFSTTLTFGLLRLYSRCMQRRTTRSIKGTWTKRRCTRSSRVNPSSILLSALDHSSSP